MLEELYIYVKNVNTEFTHFTKINPEYRPKCKILNYKISRKQLRRKSKGPLFGNEILDTTPKALFMKIYMKVFGKRYSSK